MKYPIIIAIVVVGILIFYGCKAFIKNTSASSNLKENNTPSIIMGLSKSSCKGSCEVFDLTIDANKKATYLGIKNVERIGTFTASLSNEQFKSIKTLIESTDFKALQSDYSTRIADLQRFTIQYDGHTVQFQRKGSPRDLLPVIDAFDDLIKELDWISK